MGMTAALGLTVPTLQMGKLRIVTCSGFLFINNQRNSIIYLKPLIFTKLLPQNASAVYCDLKHVLLGALFPSQHAKSIVGSWTDISTPFPRRPNLSLPHKHTYKQAILQERTYWLRFIFAGNYPFTSSINGLNQLRLTEFILATLNSPKPPSQQHNF